MKKNLLLSISSGLLLWLAWPPTPYTTILLFVGFVPMLLAMENIIQSNSTKKGKHIFNTTFIGFVIWNTLCVYWVYNSLKIIGPVVAVPISLIPYTLGPALMSTACWLYYRLRLKTNRTVGLIGLVCFWIAYEYLHQSWDLNFPWMTLGNGFAVSHQWVQWYEYTGVYGGTIWVWAANILLFLIYVGIREAQAKKLRMRLIIALALVLVIPMGISINRYYGYEEQVNPANIIVAQPNIDPYEKGGTIPVFKQIETLTKLSDSLAQPNTEFFIWPETAIPDYIDENHILTNNYYLQVRRFLDKYKNGNVLTGGETYRMYDTRATKTASPIPGGGFWDHYSSAINIENSAKVQFYHKSRLVPGAESLPFGNALSFLKPVFEHLGGATGAYTMQAEPGVLYAQSGVGVTPVICYESIWGEWVAKSVRQGSQFIAIITNDGWWENTSGKDQHLDYAKLRAIETRRWVCRSANTGISAFINQRGDIVQHSAWWVRTALKQDINLNSDITFYVEYGDYLPKLGSVLAVLGILFLLAIQMKSGILAKK
ncbi:apolipoprotein N-acyltransferase [Mucilaginibacter psychrotolerans]|uniref:Apolipoprotein N-acyltransferase n=1 Tax=Mucilaginibacter psychrotolerans TaxID=1524096 RepID=A0A4Y8S6K9_9SPHI|nr:apolipoprotein N-acyltransferase [Mucilaginibacter psychrotolerans]TFF34024.1 apolipoprotein N-acyltransferase [Mucilaginibacter psychrotolerans]